MVEAAELLWAEKYRPRTLDEVVNQEDIVVRLKKFIKEKNLPNLLFAGPPGTGKTTIALALAYELYGENYGRYLLELNASVSKDTPVLVRIGGRVERVKFADLGEKYFRNGGIIRIGDGEYVRTEDLEILTLNKDTGKVEWRRASWLIRHRAPRILKVKVKGGGTIELTGNHSVMVIGENGELVEKSAKDLKPGDYLVSFVTRLPGRGTVIVESKLRRGAVGAETPSRPRLYSGPALLLEPYVAEGSGGFRKTGRGTPTSGQLVVALGHPREAQTAKTGVASIYGIPVYGNVGRSGFGQPRSSPHQAGLPATSLGRPIKGAVYGGRGLAYRNERVPSILYEAPAGQRIGFLKSLYQVSGSGAWGSAVRIVGASKELLIDVAWLARISGIESSIYGRGVRLAWKGTVKYRRSGLLPAKPFIKFFEEAGGAVKTGWRSRLRHQLYGGKETISKDKLQKLLDAVDEHLLSEEQRRRLKILKILARSDIHVVKVASVELADYNDYVYDVSVPGNNMFFAGTIPILLHNSDERGIDIIRTKVKEFARSRVTGDVPFKIVLLDEADNMCLHPDTEVIVGTLDNLRVMTLRELKERYGGEEFDIPSLNFSTLRPENDKGHIVDSGEADLYEIALEDGRRILASPEHPFFAIDGWKVRVVRTKELAPGTEIADFSNKFLKCKNCGKLFYRHHLYEAYKIHFCSKKCRDEWLGKRLSETRGQRISEGAGRVHAERPELRMKVKMTAVTRGALAQSLRHRGLAESGFSKRLAYSSWPRSTEAWNGKGSRSRLEEVMANLLRRWGIPFERGVYMRIDGATTYVDFVLGKRVAILVNDCWWHCCSICGVEPRHPSQKKNIAEDVKLVEALQKRGYKVVVVWGHELRSPESVKEVRERIYEALAISGHMPPKVRHSKVRSVRYLGRFKVLNVSVRKNKNFFLANGILTHNTSDAQQALRRLMELYTATTRFILIANFPSKIIEPIQSRCAFFRFTPLKKEDVVARLKWIADREGVEYREEGLETIYEISEGDMRRAINILQAAAALGEVTTVNVYKVVGLAHPKEVREMIQLALKGDFTGARSKLRQLMIEYGLSGLDIVKQIHREIFSNDVSLTEEQRVMAADYIGEIQFRLVEGGDDEIQLNALLAWLALLGMKTR